MPDFRLGLEGDVGHAQLQESLWPDYAPLKITQPAVEIEIEKTPALSEGERRLLEAHSFLNIVSVISGELQYLEEITGTSLQPARRRVEAFRETVLSQEPLPSIIGEAEGFEKDVRSALEDILVDFPNLILSEDARESSENLDAAFSILQERCAEIWNEGKDRNKWRSYEIRKITQSFNRFFAAIEKNSRGRFRLVTNIAEKGETDYILRFKITSAAGNTVILPPTMMDIMRDLIANARKYTPPGGRIDAGLNDDGRRIRFVVEDTGRGIAPGQLEKVVAFGQRGSNVLDKRTLGGGFGLTKAVCAIRALGGRIWIRSDLNRGTRVTIEIPRPNK